MKHFKHFLFIITIVTFTVFFIYMIYMSQCVSVEYCFNRISENGASELLSGYSGDKNQVLDNLISEFNLNKDEANDLYNNPDDYAFINLTCRVNNNSIFNIYDYNFGVKSRNEKIITTKDEFNHYSLRRIVSKDYGVEGLTLLVKNPDDFKLEMLNDIKIYTYKFSVIYGFFFSNRSRFIESSI